ncbi:MAG TPA: carbohydrate binding family 9 domain-containing protein, partial [Gammaproteobacteria bacterium]|nr:carbohydrate binding family 9 domain-containing protein [Gammaproteobacteria bacterium]
MISLKQWICAAGFCLAASCVAAQNNAVLQDPGQKSVRVVRTSTPPVIDGDLSDAVWANAAVVDDLHQVTPIEYAEPDERTEILILYDDDALYVAARLYDNDPGEITARNMRQNDNLGQDDRFYVTIDPFNDRRSGYFFGLNPNGVRADGLYRNVTEFYGDWDSIYDAAAGRFDGGWTAEIEIPYKSISFDPTTDTWGLNFSRTVVRKNE